MTKKDYEDGFVAGVFEALDRLEKDFDALYEVTPEPEVKVVTDAAKTPIGERRRIAKEATS